MSTRSSIFYVEDAADKSSCHIYWELAEREVQEGKMVAAPLLIELETKGKCGTLRIPADVARAICEMLDKKPSWQII